MNRLLALLFLFVFIAAIASVVDATTQSNALIVSGVRVEKEKTSSQNYVYWTFTNNNPFPVEVTYTVANYPSGVVVLREGEKQRSNTAYSDQLECKVVVKKSSIANAEQRKGLSRIVNLCVL